VNAAPAGASYGPRVTHGALGVSGGNGCQPPPPEPPGPGGCRDGRHRLRQPAARRRWVTPPGGAKHCGSPWRIAGTRRQVGRKRTRRHRQPPPSKTPGRVPFPDTHGLVGRSIGRIFAPPGGSPATPPAVPPFWFSGFLKTPQTHARSGPGVARQKTVFEATSTLLPCDPAHFRERVDAAGEFVSRAPRDLAKRGPRPGVQPAVSVHRPATDVPHIPVPMIIMHVHMHRAYSPGGSRCH
jgi:hypothetical protein